MSDRAWSDGPMFQDTSGALAAESKRLGRMVDRFAVAMKVKLRKKAQEGYGGWDDPVKFPDKNLHEGLFRHVERGDWIDIANFAAMIWYRQQTRKT